MTIRVAQVGTGNAGMLTLRQLIADDRFELVAVSVSTPDKVGKDAGELAGLDVVTGIAAVGDLDALIAAEPECVVYCAMGDTRPVEATNDVRKLLEAGIDVVGSAPGTLQFPWGTMPEKVIDKVEASARAGDATVYITGVDPGFASDLVPLALASTCQRIEQIKCYELADYATYDGAEVMFDLMGFGHPVDSTPLLFLPGVLGLAWGTAIRMMATGARRRGRRDRRVLGGRAGARDLRHRRRPDREGHHRGPALLDLWHGRRAPRDRRRARHPDPRRPAPRLGPARPRAAAPTASRSPASRATSSTSSRAASTATTTTPRSWRPAAGS